MRREIFAIALPAIISNITTPLLALVDVAITGHIGDAVYIGAIAVGGSMFNMLYWLFNFLRMGSSGLTAQAYGAGRSGETATIFYRALLVGLAIATLMIALREPLADAVLRFMDADDSTQSLARSYFRICIWGAPAVMMTYGLSGWFLGMQNSKATMWVALITNVVNIAASLMLVYGLGWKIEGVACGTTIAQWIGALAGLLIAARKYRPAFPGFSKLLNKTELMGFFRLNSDIFLRTACLVAVTLWFTHAGALQGTDILAANALLLQLFMLFSFFMDGFAFAGEALAGKYMGKGDFSALKKLIGTVMRIGLLCAAIFSVLYAAGGKWFLELLAEDQNVVGLAHDFLPWAIVIPLCGFSAFVWDGILVGLTRTRAMLLAMACAMIAFFAIYLSLRTYLGNNALWLSFNIYLLMRGLCEWLIYRRAERRVNER